MGSVRLFTGALGTLLSILCLAFAAEASSANLGAVVAAAPAKRPGYLGFGYTYTPPARSESGSGWLSIRVVLENTPASEAGILVQDVIEAIDGKPLRFADDLELLERLATVRPGDRVSLSVVRGGKRLTAVLSAGIMSDEIYERWKKNFEVAKERRSRESTKASEHPRRAY